MAPTYQFTFDDIPDLSGKIAIVTGGNSGLGEVIARELARKNAKVYIAARSQARVTAAIARIKQAIGTDENLHYLETDLETMASAAQSATYFTKLETKLDILVANAGLGAIKSELTPDGYERNFGINHLGHFAFVMTLLPLLKLTAVQDPTSEVRIVIQSSQSYQQACLIDYEDLTKTYKSIWHPLTLREMLGRYARSKLCNIYFMLELADRLKDIPNIYVNATHPGLVYTHIFDLSTSPLPYYMQRIGEWHAWLCGIPVDHGAKTVLFCAASKQIIDDDLKAKFLYPAPQGPFGGFVYFSGVYPRELTALGANRDESKKLWEFSERALSSALSNN
ncbi:uncharacterized protein V1516DRAFT_559670 [Lipomyces oligophaga]|uniref:uncharacterized protein n=1 Tax=Lipomyces oligophaga TaxID=45792 RepID=UPI0034CE47CA